ncbi:MAG: putative iron-regulated membrane protein [Saprospiraceae bacterium]
MKLNKKIFFKIHSWIGIKLSILFFIVCFSGTLATLSHEIDWLFIPEMRATYEGSYASRNLMIENVQEAYPEGRITYWAAAHESYLCDHVQVVQGGQRYYVFVNPYTAEVQGDATLTFQRFFRDFHYFLFLPFQVGKFTVLFFGFILFISTTTALLFYKKWWTKLFILKTGKGKLVFYRSLHRLVGLWSIPFAILFSVTGMWYFMERTDVGGLGRAVNPRSPKLETIEQQEDMTSLSYKIDYDRAISEAQKVIPGLKVNGISPPSNQPKPIYLRGKSHVPLVRDRANRVFINPYTYEVMKVQRAEDISTIMYLNDIADPLHFGYWGGLWTKIIWFIAGLAISGLVLSGIWIALKRQVKKRPVREIYGRWMYVNIIVVIVMIGFMYHFMISRYAASTEVLVFTSLILGVSIILAWYVFVYRLYRAVR